MSENDSVKTKNSHLPQLLVALIAAMRSVSKSYCAHYDDEHTAQGEFDLLADGLEGRLNDSPNANFADANVTYQFKFWLSQKFNKNDPTESICAEVILQAFTMGFLIKHGNEQAMLVVARFGSMSHNIPQDQLYQMLKQLDLLCRQVPGCSTKKDTDFPSKDEE